MGKEKNHSLRALLPAEAAERFRLVRNSDLLTLVAQEPIRTDESEVECLQRSFLEYLNARTRETETVRVDIRDTAFARLQEQADQYGLSRSMFLAFQLMGEDPRGFIPSMPYTTALKRYVARMNEAAK